MSGDRVTIACVTEGHGEVKALPKLLYRIARDNSVGNLDVPEPFRSNRGSLIAPGGLEKAVQAMALRTRPVVTAPDDPEQTRGAKEWLSRQRTDGGRYSPTVDQAVLASRFDMKLARAGSPSFDKFCREVEMLLGVAPGEQA